MDQVYITLVFIENIPSFVLPGSAKGIEILFFHLSFVGCGLGLSSFPFSFLLLFGIVLLIPIIAHVYKPPSVSVTLVEIEEVSDDGAMNADLQIAIIEDLPSPSKLANDI